MRKLSSEFFTSLEAGVLHSLLERVKGDDTLDLQIRDDSLNIYYRGVSVLHASSMERNRYRFSFDTNYFKYTGDGDRSALAQVEVATTEECARWCSSLPVLKDAMDRYGTSVKSQAEREIQQLLVRENNRSAVSVGTDYFICDVEYADAGFRFDIMAVLWPSTPQARKNRRGLRLAFVELKFGDGALNGTAGLVKHVQDAERIASDRERLDLLKREMADSFNQKLDLGLIGWAGDRPGKIESFSDEKPQLLMVLANHDPASTTLSTELGKLPPHPHVDLRFAKATWFGYGLHESALMTLEEFRTALG